MESTDIFLIVGTEGYAWRSDPQGNMSRAFRLLAPFAICAKKRSPCLAGYSTAARILRRAVSRGRRG